MAETKTIEFSRLQPVDEIGRDGVFRKLSADACESAALAKRFDIIKITDLKAELNLRHIRGGDIISVSGTLEALVEQECVVSLELVSSKICTKIDERFARNAETVDDILVSVEEPEEIDDLIVGNEIDLGEMLAQCLYLALNSYPRKNDVKLEEGLEVASEEIFLNPFSVLEKLNAKENH